MKNAEYEISAFQKAFNVSRETIDRLKIYEQLLKKWNPKINLVGKSTISEIWGRHFQDSAQVWSLRPKVLRKWLDIGSGGGFPGLVIAILAEESHPDLKVTLVESDTRKATFLRVAARDMRISPTIIAKRVEHLPPQGADVVSARALAPLDKLFEYSSLHLAKNGCCLFSKGQNYESELTEAAKQWKFNVKRQPSITDSSAVVLEVGGLGRVEPK